MPIRFQFHAALFVWVKERLKNSKAESFSLTTKEIMASRLSHICTPLVHQSVSERAAVHLELDRQQSVCLAMHSLEDAEGAIQRANLPWQQCDPII